MSLAAQEQALFDLLFDADLRSRFVRESTAALSGYDMTDTERADFSTVRHEALALDAQMRAGFVLSHLCRTYPLSFSLASSLPRGTTLLRELVDTHLMHTAPVDRPAAFGTRLRERLAGETFAGAAEQAAVLAVVEAEIGMALTAGALRRAVLDGGPPPVPPPSPPAGWQARPVSLAPHVSAAVLPRGYGTLKEELCPCPDTALWDQLNSAPLPASLRSRALAQEAPRVLLARARCRRASTCDVDVDHATVELSAGFAPLLEHVNGAMSTGEILAGLRAIGAPEALLGSVESGFGQLLGTGMIEIAAG